MPKDRRDPVEELLGSASPVIGRIARQLDEAKAASTEPASNEAAVTAKKQQEPKKKERARGTRSSGEKAPTGTPNPPPAALASYESGLKQKRVPMSSQEIAVAEEAMAALQDHLGAKMEFSVVSRCLWSVLAENQEAFTRVTAPELRKPARADVIGNADFEERLTEYLMKVFQKLKR